MTIEEPFSRVGEEIAIPDFLVVDYVEMALLIMLLLIGLPLNFLALLRLLRAYRLGQASSRIKVTITGVKYEVNENPESTGDTQKLLFPFPSAKVREMQKNRKSTYLYENIASSIVICYV